MSFDKQDRVEVSRGRLKELECLCSLLKIAIKSTDLGQISREAVILLPSAFRYPDIACVRVSFLDSHYASERFKETQWRLASDIFVNGRKEGRVEFCYLEEPPVSGADFFLEEERRLIGAVAYSIGKVIECRQTEDKLMNQYNLLYEIIEGVTDVIFVKDLQGRYLMMNSIGASMLNRPAADIVGMTDLELFPEEEARDFMGTDRRVIASGEVISLEEKATLSGKAHIMFSMKAPYRDCKGNVIGIIAILRDITELKKTLKKEQEVAAAIKAAEIDKKRLKQLDKAYRKLKSTKEELARADKLAAIGKLAGLVSHELRDPLGVIRNSAYFIGARLGGSTDEKIKKHLNILREEVDKSDGIIADILDFSRLRTPKLSGLNLNVLIRKVFRKLSIPKNIKVCFNLDRKLPDALMDSVQIERVIPNIILNAVQAMPNGGKLEIRTFREGGFICSAFKDTGCGIKPQELKKIFEPLFSTKPKGVGLGLTLCQSVVDNHKGQIEVRSVFGKGAEFIVRIPVIKKNEVSNG